MAVGYWYSHHSAGALRLYRGYRTKAPDSEDPSLEPSSATS